MARSARWVVTAVAATVVFVVCLRMGRSVSFGWMPEAEADRWVVATAFATVVSTVTGAAGAWWAGLEQPDPSSPPAERVVSQQVTASGHGRAVQVGGNQNTSFPSSAGAGGVPGRVDQDAKVSDDASITQVGGDQHRGPGDDERQQRP
ncbi:hypothetical protein OH738_30990 [Streptomyces hirsutus]|uniref:hypothetical protein n=1 Tax=Streptomyces hirsutus TaxID=35620 RepID=UPI00386EB898|nr:hypothetical protein OH738_30990 [Streptomyces hirsutus]